MKVVDNLGHVLIPAIDITAQAFNINVRSPFGRSGTIWAGTGMSWCTTPLSFYICVIEFNESPESEPYYFLRREFGKIHDSELMNSLYSGTQVPLEQVKKSYSNIQYYDAKPPMQLLLIRLWTDYFPSKLEEGEYDEQTKSRNIQVTILDVSDELQKAFGSQALFKDDRSGEFPAQRWLREAFDRLVHYKLAAPGAADGEYIIFFRIFRDEVLERFVKFEIQKSQQKKKKPSPKQLKLFQASNKQNDLK